MEFLLKQVLIFVFWGLMLLVGALLMKWVVGDFWPQFGYWDWVRIDWAASVPVGLSIFTFRLSDRLDD